MKKYIFLGILALFISITNNAFAQMDLSNRLTIFRGKIIAKNIHKCSFLGANIVSLMIK
jgi:hypothetical protein